MEETNPKEQKTTENIRDTIELHSPDKKDGSGKKKLIIAGLLMAVIAISGVVYVATKEKKTVDNVQVQTPSQVSESCGQDTGYTCVKEDVIAKQTFACEARSDQEWYRTDRTFVVDHSDPNSMYVSVEYKGIYKSVDGGKTWAQKVKGIKVYANEADKSKGCYGEYPVIRMNPKNNKHLVIALSSGGGAFLDAETPNSQVGGVYQTVDGGETWQLMITNKMNAYVNDVAFDPVDTDTIYYATASIPSSWTDADQNKLFVTKGLVYKTTDKGKNWTELSTGIGKNTGVTAILINSQNPSQINGPTFSAVRQSADGTGTGVSNGKDTTVTQLGIFNTEDGGNKWNTSYQLPGNPPIISAVASKNNWNIQYFVPSMQQASGPPKAYATQDGGKTFTASDYKNVVAFDPFDATGKRAIAYTTLTVGPASENLTLHESTDGAKTWKKYGVLPKEIQDPNNPKTKVSNIVWHPSEPKTFFLSGAGGLVWKTTDDGKSWNKLLSFDML